MTGDVVDGTEGPQDSPDTVGDRQKHNRIAEIREATGGLVHGCYESAGIVAEDLQTTLELMHEALELGDDVPADVLRRTTHWLNIAESLAADLFLAAHTNVVVDPNEETVDA